MSWENSWQRRRVGTHEKYKNVYLLKNTKTGEFSYEGKISYKGATYSMIFDCPIKASKFVDRKCLELKIPQKNNSYGRI